jgi:hypothetical protein
VWHGVVALPACPRAHRVGGATRQARRFEAMVHSIIPILIGLATLAAVLVMNWVLERS